VVRVDQSNIQVVRADHSNFYVVQADRSNFSTGVFRMIEDPPSPARGGIRRAGEDAPSLKLWRAGEDERNAWFFA
jgi:hypothetical protein